MAVSIVNHSGEEATTRYDTALAINEKLGITTYVIEVAPDEVCSREQLELTHGTGAFDVIQYHADHHLFQVGPVVLAVPVRSQALTSLPFEVQAGGVEEH